MLLEGQASLPELIGALGNLGIASLMVIALAYLGVQWIRSKGRNGNGKNDGVSQAIHDLGVRIMEESRVSREHMIKSAEAYRQNTAEHQALLSAVKETLDLVGPRRPAKDG